MRAARAGLGIAVLAATLLLAPAALGANGAKSRITIKRISASGASGEVRSQSGACVSGRKVTLFRLDDFISVKVEITRSHGHGRWRVKRPLKPGRYFAKVDASRGNGQTCLFDDSRRVTLR
jgi:hypothetical protein